MQDNFSYSELLNNLIFTLVKETGSDIHMISGMSPAVRIHSELITISKVPKLTPSDTVSILREMIDDEKYKQFIEKQQVDFSYVHNKEYRLRGHAFFQMGSVAIVMRLIPKVKTIQELGLPPIIYEIAKKDQGFFLVVGPVGQGKSTTLAAMVNEINKNEKRTITTIEDPIEYIHESDKSYIMQREIGFDTSSAAIALEAAFRQDVDVILVGEMRDIDTIRTAVTAAETGHLVFSTLHTNSASQTIDRIIDSFSANQQDQVRTQLAASLIGVFSQRLLPKIGGGLVPVYELMLVNNAVQNLIREKRVYEIDNIIDTGMTSGMISFDRCLSDAVIRGDVALDDAVRVAKNPKLFGQLIDNYEA
jgi:twitching motility protein PilT